MKKLFVNKDKLDRYVESEGKINKPKIRPTYWFFEPVGTKNVSLKFVPTADRAGFGPNSLPKGMYMTDDSGVCKHRRFRLSVCGLDKFKVMFGCQRDGSDKVEAEEYEVWRRIYFSVRYMRTAFLFPYGPVKSEYHKHGIAPKEISPAGAARIRHVEILESHEQGLDRAQDVTEPHLEARIVMVDRLWLTSSPSYRLKTGQAVKVVNYPEDVWPVGKFIVGNYEGIDISTIATRTGERQITFDFSSQPQLIELQKHRKLDGRYSVKFRTKVLNGCAESETGRIVICARGRYAPIKNVAPRQGTMIHEMGHGLRMVPKKIQEYNEYNGNPIASRRITNPTHYSNGGGHCNTNASGTDPDFEEGSCVMYHSGWSGRPHAFCPDCEKIVKRKDMNRKDMPWPA